MSEQPGPTSSVPAPGRLPAEVRDRFGVLPNSFRLTPETPEITENLWGFARFAYLDNPLPSLFKERLFVYLSRFCEVRYCIARHVGFLVGLGHPSGDHRCPPETIEQAVKLIRRELPRGGELEPHLARLEALSAPPATPAADTPVEEAVLACATHVFLQTPQAGRSLEALRRAFDAPAFQHLLVFLTFVRTAHFWTRLHPALRVEEDVAALLAAHEALAEGVLNDPEAAGETTQRLLEELAELRQGQARRQEVVRANVAGREAAEAAARSGEEKYRTLFESIDEGFCIIEVLYDAGRPVDYRVLEANPAFERQTGIAGGIGQLVREFVPGHEAHWLEVYGRVAETGEPARFQHAATAPDRYYDVYAFRIGAPDQRRVAVLFTDVTDRKRAEDRQAFWLRLSDTLRPLAAAVEIQAAATRVLGEHLGAQQAHYGETVGDEVVVRRGYGNGRPPMVGRFRPRDFGERLVRTFRSGRTAASADVTTDPTITDAERAVLAAAGIRGYVAVPLVKGGEWVATLAVHSTGPRAWTPDEVALVEGTAEQTWAAVERAKAEVDLRERETWLRGQREALETALNGSPLEASLGTLVRTATDTLGEGTRAAFYLAGGDGTSLYHVVGMSPDYAAAVDGFKIGPESLGCGLTAATGEPVLTADVATDPRWEPWRWLAERFDYRGCWSFPVRTAAGGFVGTLAVYSRRPREATPRDRELAALLTHTAAIIVSRHREAEARRQAEHALRESEERLNLAVVTGELGTWDWDVRTGRVVWNARHFSMQGYTVGEVAPTYEAWLDRVHPDDRPGTLAALAAARDARAVYRHEFRSLHPGGAVRWLSARGNFFYDEAGTPVRMVGVVRDVTDQRLAEEELRRNEERQAFLLKVNDALRAQPDAESIERTSLEMLAEHLGLDRAYVARVDEEKDEVLIGPEYRRPNLKAITGVVRATAFPTALGPAEEGTVVVKDRDQSPELTEADRRSLAALGFKAFVSTGGRRGGGNLIRALGGVMATPRAWTPNEVILIESVSERTWAAAERIRAETALRASEEKYRTLFENIDEGFYFAEALFDASGLCTDIYYLDENPAAVRMIRQSAKGRLMSELAPYEQYWRDMFGTTARTGEPLRREEYAAPDGIWYEFHAFKPPQARGNQFAVIFRDVTARRRAVEAVRESEIRLRAVIEEAPLAIAFTGPAGEILFRNPRFDQLCGRPAHLTTARTYSEVYEGYHPDGRPVASEEWPGARAILKGESIENEVYEIVRPGGRRVTCWFGAAPVRNASGGVVGAVVVFRDVTEERRTAAALRVSEERLRLALSAARMGTWAWDVAADTHYRDANLNALLGLPAEETNLPIVDFFAHIHPDDQVAVRAAFDQSVRHGRPLAAEFRVVWPDGAVRWLRDQGDVFGTAGRARMAGACVDVTDRRQAQDALRASEDRLRQVVDGATDYAILTLDRLRRITSWSPGAAAVFGLSAGEALGSPVDLLFSPEDRGAGVPEREAWAADRNGRAADERWHVRKDGSRFYASGVLTPYGPAGAMGYVKVLRDLTDRKRMEDALRDARDRLEERVAERTAELAAALDSLETEMARRHDLARRLTTAQEDERQRISRDLHDTIGQLMAGLSLAFKAVETAGHLPPATAAKLTEAQQVANTIGKEVHALAVRLRPTALDDVGLEAALGQLVAEWSTRTGVGADFQAVGLGSGRLPPEVETAVYRIVQEALTNAAKHSRATQVSVVVTRPDGHVTAVVEDDGGGFDPDAPQPGRLGLLGMRERAALVGGEVDLESAPGSGTTVVARIPVPDEER